MQVNLTKNLLLLCALFVSGTLAALTVPDLRSAASQRFGASALETVTAWEQLIASHRGNDIRQQLTATNDFFNQQVRWVSDQEAWQVEDYWATPLETMGKAIGDCEDFSIAKYATLLLMGVDPTSLRMVYVKAKRGGLTQAHMVLAWYRTPQSEPLILDNLDFVIRPASERGDLFPVFSFNGEAIWVGNRAQPSSANPMTRLSRWRQVLEQMREEGFNLGS